MGMPWGTVDKSFGTHIDRYRILPGGQKIDFSWDQNVKYQSTNRVHHTSNPPTASGFRYPSDYFTSTEKWDTKRGSMNWEGAAGREFLSGLVTGWMEDHVGTIGPCLTGDGTTYDPNMESQAITECLNKLGDAKTSVLQNLATARQTASLLGDTVGNLADMLRAVRRGNIRRGLRSFTDASGNLFLIWKFGWEPLVKDASGALDLMLNENLAPTVGVTRNVRKQVSNSGIDRSYRFDGNYTANTKCRLWATVDDTWQRGVAQSGAGIGSIPYVAWDLVPWSFVVDWVLPIGGVLQALTATAGLSFTAGYVSHYVRGSKNITSIPPDNAVVTADFGGKYECNFYKRRTLSGFPMPEPYVKSPFTVTHALESLSLLNQLRHKL